MRYLAIVLPILMAVVTIQAEEKPASIPAIDITLKEFPKTKITDYLTVTDEKKLKEAITDKDSFEKIKVDFTKQKVIIFAWSGSGGDTLTATGDAKEVTLTHLRGKSKDLRGHTKAFVVAKDAKITMVAK